MYLTVLAFLLLEIWKGKIIIKEWWYRSFFSWTVSILLRYSLSRTGWWKTYQSTITLLNNCLLRKKSPRRKKKQKLGEKEVTPQGDRINWNLKLSFFFLLLLYYMLNLTLLSSYFPLSTKDKFCLYKFS